MVQCVEPCLGTVNLDTKSSVDVGFSLRNDGFLPFDTGLTVRLRHKAAGQKTLSLQA